MEEQEEELTQEFFTPQEEIDDQCNQQMPAISTPIAVPTTSQSTTTSGSVGPSPPALESSTASWEERIQKLPKELRNIVAGGIAGMVAKSVVAPIDRIKILFQTSAMTFRLQKVPQVALSICKNEGVSALWKGNLATMIRVFPYSGIQFMVFDRCKTYYLHQLQHRRDTAARQPTTAAASLTTLKKRTTNKWGLTPFESFVAGSVAGAVSVTVTYPLDLTRAQLAVLMKHRHQTNPGFTAVLFENYKSRGLLGLFRGITPTILGILPYSGVAFAINEQGKTYITHLQKREPTTFERMQCGALSGLCAQTMTYPLEVTRRRMQTIGIVPTKETAVASLAPAAGNGATKLPPPDHPVSMMTTMELLWKEQGIRGFYKGVSMNWMKGPVAFSISFTTFDIVQGWVENEQERSLRTGRPRQ